MNRMSGMRNEREMNESEMNDPFFASSFFFIYLYVIIIINLVEDIIAVRNTSIIIGK